MTFVVGLTGGIGSGKSTVCRLFEELGVPVLDADVVAREVVAPGSPALEAIAADFGREVIGAGGALDRAALRRRVFADPHDRERLEALLHPLIRARITAAIGRIEAPYCVVSIPLLVESGWIDLVDRIAVVDVPESVQKERTARRDGLTAAEVEAIMRTQAGRAQRLAHADDVIHNEGDLNHLRAQVEALHRLYGELGRRRESTLSEHR